MHPPPGALETAQDRLLEKRLFERLGIPTPGFRALDSQADVDGLETLPAVLKTRRMGYDGKGQTVARERGQLAGAFAALGGVPLIAEQLVEFDRELSIVAARGRDGADGRLPAGRERAPGRHPAPDAGAGRPGDLRPPAAGRAGGGADRR